MDAPILEVMTSVGDLTQAIAPVELGVKAIAGRVDNAHAHATEGVWLGSSGRVHIHAVAEVSKRR